MNTDYIKRINKILHYIEDHLSEELSLETIAGVAAYSPFHLHRLFKAIAGETLNNYIIRKRIERAAMQLIHKKEQTISEIAEQTGFKSNTSFTRSFNKLYGQSPTDFRKANSGNFSKIGKTDSKNGQVSYITEEYLCNINNLKNWIKMHAKVEVKEMPPLHVAYLTQIGENGIETTFQKIITWARPKGLLAADDSHVIRLFHDSFKITDANKVRMSIGVTVKENFKVDAEIGLMHVARGKYIVGRFEITVPEFENAWNSLFLWMAEQGYKKAEGAPYEIYRNNFKEHPEKKYLVDLCIPVE